MSHHQRVVKQVLNRIADLRLPDYVRLEAERMLKQYSFNDCKFGETLRGLVAFIVCYACNKNSAVPHYQHLCESLNLSMLRINHWIQIWSTRLDLEVEFSVEREICGICQRIGFDEARVPEVCTWWTFVQTLGSVRLNNLAPVSCAAAMVAYYLKHNRQCGFDSSQVAYAVNRSIASINSNISLIEHTVKAYYDE